MSRENSQAISEYIADKPFIEEAEDVALIGLKAMRAFLAYTGENKDYLNKAKIGAQAVQGYTRHFASLTNRDMLKLAQQKTLSGSRGPKALPSAE